MAQLWGGRFTKETDQLVYNFNASISFDQKFYEQDIRGSMAHVRMLARQNILTEKEKEQQAQLKGFDLLRHEILRFDFSLGDSQSVQDLLSMTPHLWRISKEGAQALARTSHLEDRAEVVFNVYGRQKR